MENWADHLREGSRMSNDDRLILASAAAFREEGARPPGRYLAIDPMLGTAQQQAANAARDGIEGSG